MESMVALEKSKKNISENEESAKSDQKNIAENKGSEKSDEKNVSENEESEKSDKDGELVGHADTSSEKVVSAEDAEAAQRVFEVLLARCIALKPPMTKQLSMKHSGTW